MTRWALAVILLATPIAALPDLNPSGLIGVSLGNSQGKSPVLKTGNLVTTSTTADQVLLTYTVTSGKTFYLQYFNANVRLTTYAATATNYGACSLESPAGTKLWTQILTNTGASLPVGQEIAEGQPVSSATVVRVVCTPAAVTSFTWQGNLGGFER